MAITPYLYYEDVERALEFLSSAFGLKAHGDIVRGADGRVNHAAVKYDDAVVMMGCPDGNYCNPKRLGQATQSLYVMVPDADKHFEHAREAGARILEKPNDTAYGHRRYGATDPEGHEWYFASELSAGKSASK